MNQELEEFRKALLMEAYQGFLDWAWTKDEIMKEYLICLEGCKARGEDFPNFVLWVTEVYWGEVDG